MTKEQAEAMPRITKTYIRERVAILARTFDISVHWAYGRPRCESKDGSRDISPRLSTGELNIWLDGFEHGAEAASKARS